MSQLSKREFVVINAETGEAIGPTDINPDGNLLQANGIRHLFCDSTMNTVPISSTHFVLYCKHCGQRLVIPRDVKNLRVLGRDGGFDQTMVWRPRK